MRLNIIDRYFLWVISTLTVAVAVLMVLLITATNPEPQIITKTIKVPIEKIVYKEAVNVNSYVQITKATLEQDLRLHYKSLSTNQRDVILTTIQEVSKQYNINPLIIYSLISVESSFRSYITHKQVVIKGKKTNGIGLGGVIYLWHGEELKQLGILETKSDLYNPAINIRAIGYILDKYSKDPLKKGTTSKTVSALRRYFGSNFKSYSDKIKYKIASLIDIQLYKDK